MANVLKPRNEAECEKLLAWAIAERKPLEIVGGGSKRNVGRPFQTEHTLDLTGLTGITLYEPEELVLRAGAGTPIEEIETALAEKGQELAFEPPDYSEFLDASRSPATLGGAVMSNMSGPRRIKVGAVRDFVLGLRAITGRGETMRVGGRVMKNVTGYDLCRGLAGSWGTLAIATEVTLKVLPAAEFQETLMIAGLSTDEAVNAMGIALGSAADVSGAAHIPQALTKNANVKAVNTSQTSVTLLRLEGVKTSVEARRELLLKALAGFGDIEFLRGASSRAIWRDVRDVKLFDAEGRDQVIWRISTSPMKAPDVVRNVSIGEETDAVYDWGGGLIWLAQPPYGDGGAAAIRAVVERAGGHATLVRAAPATRMAVQVFEPQADALASLTRRLKAAFDPHGILNPGRMYAGV
jgi:glycolate oxidase FAD binding subunit